MATKREGNTLTNKLSLNVIIWGYVVCLCRTYKMGFVYSVFIILVCVLCCIISGEITSTNPAFRDG